MSKPSEEERRAWDRLDEAIKEHAQIGRNLDEICNDPTLRQMFEDAEQLEALRQRQENPPKWWERLLGL